MTDQDPSNNPTSSSSGSGGGGSTATPTGTYAPANASGTITIPIGPANGASYIPYVPANANVGQIITNGITWNWVVGGGGAGSGGQCEEISAPPEVKEEISYGCFCQKCKDFYPHAEIHRDKEFTCYGCRMVW